MLGLLFIMILWLGLMWKLSTADGTETLRDSMQIARKLGTWLYNDPTIAQLSQLNVLIRKMAHVFLYSVLGLLLGLFFQLVCMRKSFRFKIGIAAVIGIGIAFLDELQKIPISGRHFDFGESLLNSASACIVIILYYGTIWLIVKHRWKKSKLI